MTSDPHPAEWHERRRRGVGGSDVAAIVGLSPWQSTFSLWARKSGELGPTDSSPEQEWGHRLEPVVLRKWAETHTQGYVTQEVRTRYGRREPWRIANPDALWTDDGGGLAPALPPAIVEVKTADTSKAHEWGPSGTDQIPPYYAAQVLWYQDVCELFEPAHLCVLIGGRDYREYVLPYDPRGAAFLRLHARRFWRTVESGEKPDIDHSDATYDALRTIHPGIDGSTVQVTEELWHGYREALAQHEHHERQHDLWRNRMLDAMGDAQYAEVDGTRVARRQRTAGEHASLRIIDKQKRHIIGRQAS